MNESNISLSNISLVNTYCKYREPDTDSEENAKHTAYVLVSVLGISFNIFIIILAAQFKRRKNLHHFIINMAVSDALFLLVRLWFYIPRMSLRLFPTGIFGVVFCKITVLLASSSSTVSLITLLIISIERVRATRQRLQRSKQYTLKQRLLVIGISWLIAAPFAVFYAIKLEVTIDGKSCFYAYDVQYIITAISIYTVVAILCCVIFVLSILTIRRLTKPQAIRNHLSEHQQNQRARRTQAAVRMVLASVLLYICCWIPLSVYSVLYCIYILITSSYIFSGCIELTSLLFIIGDLLPGINSCFSPIIYIIFLSDFRQAAKKVFYRRNTVNQEPNRQNVFELQPIPKRTRNCQEDDIELETIKPYIY